MKILGFCVNLLCNLNDFMNMEPILHKKRFTDHASHHRCSHEIWQNEMSRIIREARPTDMAEIMKVMDAAKGIMRQSGNMHQWGEGYPSEAVIKADMERNGGFIIEDDACIVGYFAFLPSPEPTYDKIYEGKWINDTQPYHVVHRIASYPDVHGIFSSIMDFCFYHDTNIRIDTHHDNKIMQHNILKHGFTYCGIIYLLSGDKRLAYQKIDI